MKKLNTKRGYTLVEMVLVVAIISILSGASLIGIVSSLRRYEEKTAITMANSAGFEAEAYRQINQRMDLSVYEEQQQEAEDQEEAQGNPNPLITPTPEQIPEPEEPVENSPSPEAPVIPPQPQPHPPVEPVNPSTPELETPEPGNYKYDERTCASHTEVNNYWSGHTGALVGNFGSIADADPTQVIVYVPDGFTVTAANATVTSLGNNLYSYEGTFSRHWFSLSFTTTPDSWEAGINDLRIVGVN